MFFMKQKLQRRFGWLRVWELALLLAFCLSLGTGAWAASRQSNLAEKLIRLHIVAVDDTEAEQAVKLQVRDAVLACLRPILAETTDAAAAEEQLRQAMPALQRAAEQAAGDRAVHIRLTEEYYPHRDYESFSLPAGEYRSLQVVLGEGQGHNWWCVVFPPLCAEAGGTKALETACLAQEDIALITEADKGCQLRFWLLDWWGARRQEMRTKTDK